MGKNVPMKYDHASSDTGGVKPMSIKGLFDDQMFRVSEAFTDADREWRRQWLRDQILSPSEPRPVPELELELKNPIRRWSSAPWKFLEEKMTPMFGSTFAGGFRYLVPKLIVTVAVIYMSYYHLKYNQNDWTRAFGWHVDYVKPCIYPGDPGFPAKRERTRPQDYDDRGFYRRKVFLD